MKEKEKPGELIMHRDVFRRRVAIIRKNEALQFMKLFKTKDQTDQTEFEAKLICTKLIEALSKVMREQQDNDDVELLTRGYQRLPKRWTKIKASVTGRMVPDRPSLDNEIQYLRLCDTALSTGR